MFGFLPRACGAVARTVCFAWHEAAGRGGCRPTTLDHSVIGSMDALLYYCRLPSPFWNTPDAFRPHGQAFTRGMARAGVSADVCADHAFGWSERESSPDTPDNIMNVLACHPANRRRLAALADRVMGRAPPLTADVAAAELRRDEHVLARWVARGLIAAAAVDVIVSPPLLDRIAADCVAADPSLTSPGFTRDGSTMHENLHFIRAMLRAHSAHPEPFSTTHRSSVLYVALTSPTADLLAVAHVHLHYTHLEFKKHVCLAITPPVLAVARFMVDSVHEHKRPGMLASLLAGRTTYPTARPCETDPMLPWLDTFAHEIVGFMFDHPEQFGACIRHFRLATTHRNSRVARSLPFIPRIAAIFPNVAAS
jgi:hypothetical protein